MSYEGYTECLCEDGHYTTMDCYERDHLICECGKLLKWTHEVDETNGEGERAEMKVAVPAVKETCAHCGHTKVIEEARYAPNSPLWREIGLHSHYNQIMSYYGLDYLGQVDVINEFEQAICGIVKLMKDGKMEEAAKQCTNLALELVKRPELDRYLRALNPLYKESKCMQS